uniref:Stc1 domain-containing protein n=1 Tax=viral metagenome TaxID=1070528 RepID=A0A6C0LZA9_9ZZZZ
MFKNCSKCLEHKSLHDFHILKTAKLGRHPQCKLCRKKKYKTNKYSELNLREICCYNCGEIKSVDQFYKNKSSSTGRQIYCKCCHRNKIKQSMSKKDNFLKLLLKKFKKKYKNRKINITVQNINDLLNKQGEKCHITKHILTTNVDIKQRTDNIWNISIMIINNNKKEIDINSVHLVCNLVYSSIEIYNLSEQELTGIYSQLNS